jgi:hypothetical protein
LIGKFKISKSPNSQLSLIKINVNVIILVFHNFFTYKYVRNYKNSSYHLIILLHSIAE